MNLKKYLIAILFLSCAPLSQASYIANRDFLSVGQGARANAMGEAFVAVADDASAIFWNSAGMTQMRGDQLSVTYADRFDGLSREAQLHYGRRGRTGMWGFGYAGSFITDIPVTQSLTQADLNAIQNGTFAPATTNAKSVVDNGLMFSYSRPLSLDRKSVV